MAGFADQLNQFADKVDARTNAVVKKIFFDLSARIMEKSPVGDAKYWKSSPPPGYVGGRFRGNWNYGVGQIDHSITEAVDPGGTKTLAAIYAKAGETFVGKVHYLTNSLPYSLRIERGNWAIRAPQGVVGITVLEFDPIVRAAVAELS